MFDENQIVQARWNNTNRKWYESKGYVYTKRYEYFDVKAKDLPYNSKVYVKVTCDLCGKELDCSMMNYNNRIDKDFYTCKKCTRKKVQLDNRAERAKKQFGKIREICKENDYELLTDESEYHNVNTRITFRCKNHGCCTVKIKDFLASKRCAKCSREEMGIRKMHTPEYIRSVIEGYNGNVWLNPDGYTYTTDRNLKIKCGLCGQVFTTSFNSYSTEAVGQRKCFSCSYRESKGETCIRKFLEDNNIDYEKEKTFDDCRDTLPLPFDFYIPKNNLLIEFDGQHHFEDRGFGDFETTKKHDAIKNQYCKDNDIRLLRIPYWDGSKVEKILTKELNL